MTSHAYGAPFNPAPDWSKPVGAPELRPKPGAPELRPAPSELVAFAEILRALDGMDTADQVRVLRSAIAAVESLGEKCELQA